MSQRQRLTVHDCRDYRHPALQSPPRLPNPAILSRELRIQKSLTHRISLHCVSPSEFSVCHEQQTAYQRTAAKQSINQPINQAENLWSDNYLLNTFNLNNTQLFQSKYTYFHFIWFCYQRSRQLIQ